MEQDLVERGICKTNIKSEKRNGWLEIIKAHDMGYNVPEEEYKKVLAKLSEKQI